jgi:hypothetical protein
VTEVDNVMRHRRKGAGTRVRVASVYWPNGKKRVNSTMIEAGLYPVGHRIATGDR